MLQRVHLIFKTHLDVGFTDLARNVVANYFQYYLPQAMSLAEQFRQSGGPERFVWTTGSWLVYEYLEQAAPAERARAERAIDAGDIAWHGLPFTTHSELMDASLFRFGLSLSQELDQRFGKHTIAAKMTDVPGHTRSIVPLLAEAGIQFLHIGVNPACTPPDVPPVFVWRDPTGAEVVVMVQKGSYGDLMITPGLDEAITFALTGDNLGPQSAQQVKETFETYRRRFPGVEMLASTMDAFASSLMAVKPQLPVVTQELGDTWIHGIGTDPKKVSQFRELLRLRRQWLADGVVSLEDKAFNRFSRYLLLVPEHTWGLDEKTHLADYTAYDAASFKTARSQPNFQKFESSWDEQRDYLRQAVRALGDLQLDRQAEERLQSLEPAPPDLSGFTPVPDPAELFETAHFRLGFDSQNGAINRLISQEGRVWASPEHLLGLFCYGTFSQEDYDRLYQRYVINKRLVKKWAIPDLSKPGMAAAGAKHQEWLPQMHKLYHRTDQAGHHFIVQLVNEGEPVLGFGCPAELWVEILAPDQEPTLQITLQWFGKRACRFPEALWYSFTPWTGDRNGWKMDKLGLPVSPKEVVCNGNRRLHAVGCGVTYQEARGTLEIVTRDAPLVAPGGRLLLEFNNRQPAAGKGMHFLLYNNAWGTNFPMWYDEDARFRFILHFTKGVKYAYP